MPGFMGLGKLKTTNTHEIEKGRRESEGPRQDSLPEMEKRAWEKVQDILQDEEAPGGDTQVLPAAKPEAGPAAAALKVGDIVSGRVVTVTFDDTVLMVKGIFDSVRFHHLPVVDGDGRLIGIISDRDFLKSVSPFLGTINEQNRDFELLKKKVGLIMTRNPVVIHPDSTVVDAVRLMNAKKVSCLPVVPKDDAVLLGIVSWKDVVRAFCPEGFTKSGKLKTGVNIRSKTAESARLSAVESARLFPRGDRKPT
ncbi:MAG: CBS domain-containing protein [Planctomycetota bacterium]|jgi:acetoin utilization protein AcuB|nr:CBS domain-containing protein [Planctomycetota bacterium]